MTPLHRSLSRRLLRYVRDEPQPRAAERAPLCRLQPGQRCVRLSLSLFLPRCLKAVALCGGTCVRVVCRAGCFACGTDSGFKIFNCDPFKETFHRGPSLALAGSARHWRSPRRRLHVQLALCVFLCVSLSLFLTYDVCLSVCTCCVCPFVVGR